MSGARSVRGRQLRSSLARALFEPSGMIGAGDVDRPQASRRLEMSGDGGSVEGLVHRDVPALAADPDVVLRVARGIVGIAGGIVRAEARPTGGIDRLIGVAAAERERHKSQEDRDPQFASYSSMTDGAVGLRRAAGAYRPPPRPVLFCA
jgi:hypothetical protein